MALNTTKASSKPKCNYYNKPSHKEDKCQKKHPNLLPKKYQKLDKEEEETALIIVNSSIKLEDKTKASSLTISTKASNLISKIDQILDSATTIYIYSIKEAFSSLQLVNIVVK